MAAGEFSLPSTLTLQSLPAYPVMNRCRPRNRDHSDELLRGDRPERHACRRSPPLCGRSAAACRARTLSLPAPPEFRRCWLIGKATRERRAACQIERSRGNGAISAVWRGRYSLYLHEKGKENTMKRLICVPIAIILVIGLLPAAISVALHTPASVARAAPTPCSSRTSGWARTGRALSI